MKKLFLWLLQFVIELVWPRKNMTDPIPSLPTSIPAAALDVVAEATALGLTLEEYKNTPAYIAGVQAKREQLERDTDQAVAVKAATGDPEAISELQRRSS